MANLWHSVRGGGNLWNSGMWGSQVGGAPRLRVSGSTIYDPSGNEIFLRGINQGTWNENFEADAAAIKALGANCVRYVFRWWGEYGDPSTDSRTESAAQDYLSPTNLAQMLEEVDWLIAQGLWVVFALDSNCGQNGIQDAGMAAYCDPTNAYPITGRNFWSDLSQRELFKAVWRRCARELRNRQYIACYEILPEPLEARDNSYAGPVRDFYTEMRSTIRQVDTKTPILVGPRDAYNITLAEEAYLSGLTDVIYTGNLLNGRVVNSDTLPLVTSGLTNVRAAHNVPLLVQQVGRETVNDTSLDKMRGVLSMLNSQKVHWTWWQYHQNTTNPDTYALYYKDGVGGWTGKTNELSAIAYYLTQDIATLEADAIAAATAAGALLYYVKNDLSNVFQNTGGTIPITEVGQAIQRIDPVVGSTVFTNATTSASPTLIAGQNRWAMNFDGVDDFLNTGTIFYASGDDTIAIAAGIPAETATNRVMFHVGASSTNARYPYLGVNATDVATTSWRGDDTLLREIDGTTNCSTRPIVLTSIKSGANKSLLVNGTQEGLTNTDAVGSIASFTRMRIGSATTTTGYFQGPISLVCIAKTMTTEQRQAIERFGAYLVGAAYQK